MTLPTTTEATKAVVELREAIGDAHRARRDLAQTGKLQREDIRAAIDAEVTRQVDALAEEIRARLYTQADEMLARLERDWRAKLGLPDR